MFKKRLLSTLLVLCTVLALLPVTAQAAETLPDWYFLVAIIKNVDADCADENGVVKHAKYTMTQDEIDFIRETAKSFDKYMNNVGVMRSHVEFVEIDTPATKLADSDYGSWISPNEAAPLLRGKVDLDRYDHVFCVASLNVYTSYGGLTGGPLENGTGETCINIVNRKEMRERFSSAYVTAVYIHEFLHFMEQMSAKWGTTFDLHGIGDKFYSNDDYYVSGYRDIILNQVKRNAELGTGVHPAAWQYPPHVLRTMRELTIPSGITTIGTWAFGDCTTLTKVFIPASVTSIEYAAFWNTGLKEVYYGGTEAQWKRISFGEFNESLTGANIHYNSTISDTSTTPNTSGTSNKPGTPNTPTTNKFTDVPESNWANQYVAWGVANNIAAGTSATTFSPNETCNQAQILSFLWRAKGSPKPAASVSSKEYYANAAQWAKEQGLISNFSANAPCTRAMVVTYLWKLAGSPVEGTSNFTDVSANASYAKAVAWAVKNNVASGMGDGSFAPNAACTRAQIMAFLYRALA